MQVLEAIKGKLEKGLAASLTESQREGLASGEGGTFAALVEELIEDKEAMALKLSHAEQQLARVQGELETKQQARETVFYCRDNVLMVDE